MLFRDYYENKTQDIQDRLTVAEVYHLITSGVSCEYINGYLTAANLSSNDKKLLRESYYYYHSCTEAQAIVYSIISG